MSSNVPEWLSCPNCGFEDFDEEEHLSNGTISCPDCGAETDADFDSGGSDLVSMEELAETAGVPVDEFKEKFTPTRREPSADDAEEVTDSGIEFIKSEDYYKAGGVTFECPDCGSECLMSCGMGYSDVAYCESCHYEYRRSREPLVDNISDGVVTQEMRTDRDVYEEYDCEYCDEKHGYTKPDGEYVRPKGEVHSLEEVSISCPCGGRVHFNGAEPDEVHNCSNCEREYVLLMNDET